MILTLAFLTTQPQTGCRISSFQIKPAHRGQQKQKSLGSRYALTSGGRVGKGKVRKLQAFFLFTYFFLHAYDIGANIHG
jgi:hypothetical protein